MKNRQRSIGSRGLSIAFPLLVVIACSEQALTTAAKPPTPSSPRFVENSEHFYYEDGYYWWDGQPPPGDLAPADIILAQAHAVAPRAGTGGWVAGKMTFVGDQSKIDLVYSVDSAGSSYWSNTEATSGWKYAMIPYNRYEQEHYFSRRLALLPMCDFSVLSGGTAYARHAIPFAIPLNLIKFKVALTFGTVSWGAVSRPLQAASDPAVPCDQPIPASECDHPSTDEIEHCPVPGDPANPPYPGGSASEPTDVRGDYAGRSEPGGWAGGGSFCVDWIDWWYSFDGGKTWHYDYRQCTEYAQM